MKDWVEIKHKGKLSGELYLEIKFVSPPTKPTKSTFGASTVYYTPTTAPIPQPMVPASTGPVQVPDPKAYASTPYAPAGPVPTASVPTASVPTAPVPTAPAPPSTAPTPGHYTPAPAAGHYIPAPAPSTYPTAPSAYPTAPSGYPTAPGHPTAPTLYPAAYPGTAPSYSTPTPGYYNGPSQTYQQQPGVIVIKADQSAYTKPQKPNSFFGLW